MLDKDDTTSRLLPDVLVPGNSVQQRVRRLEVEEEDSLGLSSELTDSNSKSPAINNFYSGSYYSVRSSCRDSLPRRMRRHLGGSSE